MSELLRRQRATAAPWAALLLSAGLLAPARAETVRICALGAVAEQLEDLGQRHSDLQLIAATPEDLAQKVVGCHAVVGLYGAIAEQVIAAGEQLQWVQTGSAGVEDFVDIAALRDSDILLTNAKIIQGPEIADHAFALLLALTRDLKYFTEQMAQASFARRSRLPMIELRGKTALILGLGGIGTQTAERAHAFGMRVLAVDPKDVPIMGAVEYVGKPDELDRLLPEADVVMSCAPLTPETRGMLGRRQFELMKQDVYLINVSRGGIVDTDALVDALRTGKVRAAGLDVTEPEPLPSDHPLWTMPNVIITPHLATASDRLEERRLELYRDNVERFLTGRPLRNMVDKHKGY